MDIQGKHESPSSPGDEPAVVSELKVRADRARGGGKKHYHQRIAEQGKLFVRVRLDLLLDRDSFVENGLLARTTDEDLAADAVVTGTGTVNGRTVAVIANDSTVKAGAWGRQTIRKIMRQQEEAELARCPLLYLVDSAGARLDEQFDLFIDRHHSGRIFWMQARLSGQIPQICVLFGPSPAGSAYLPAFCDAVIMVDGNATAFLGSPRMVEMATGEKVSAEEMGGARMHCQTSGLGDQLAATDADALDLARKYLSYLPDHADAPLPESPPADPADGKSIDELVPEAQNRAFDAIAVILRIVDGASLFQHRELFAPELITAFARINGRPVGIVANQPKRKGGILTGDSAEKGAQFVQLCDAYGIPLVFFSDTPGFMVGTTVERGGIIRRGAKYLSAIAEASVPRICVVLRKSYGAGYMAMSGASFSPDATIALPHAKLAIMGPEAAVNAIFLNKINAIEDLDARARYVQDLREEYMANVDIFRAASATYLDAVVLGDDLRRELVRRLERYAHKSRERLPRRHAVIRG